MIVTDSADTTLASITDLQIGPGPFFLVLGQREGAPYTVGVNEAIWKAVGIDVASAAPIAQSRSHQEQGSAGLANRSTDIRNFAYPSNCYAVLDSRLPRTITVTNGQWEKKEDDGYTTLHFDLAKMATGRLGGNDSVETVVVTSCTGATNYDYEELFVFDTSSGVPQLVGKLAPADWGKGQENNGGDFPITNVAIANRQLAISFLAGGSHACPAAVVATKFQWNGSHFFEVGQEGKPYVCGR